MFHGVLIAAAFFGGELVGTLVELRGHVGGFFGWAAEGDEHLGKLRNIHSEIFTRTEMACRAETRLPAVLHVIGPL